MALASPILEYKVEAVIGDIRVHCRRIMVWRPRLIGTFRCCKQFLTLLACIFFCGSASASCLSNPLFAHDHVVYAGEVGNRQIRLTLQFDALSQQVSGMYGISGDSISHDIPSQPDGEAVTIHIAGKNGRSDQLRLRAVDSLAAIHSPDANGCLELDGVYLRNGLAEEDVKLLRVTAIKSEYDADRKANEAVALRFQRALIARDKQIVASLLIYPFFSQYGRKTSVWKDAGEVVKHYDEAIQFDAPALRKAVPFLLESRWNKSEFFDGAVCLSEQKVEQMCIGPCVGGCP
ncbi:hypothetical protein ISN75_03515 [Dyella marensis]|uniref:hypothetical protein n=1 Tax=Dyella marensis TaxID=500610 RepID=UPI0031D838DC